ncbi:MAG: RrF2 family transcriptional regulator [Phycisphaerae bacterium]
MDYVNLSQKCQYALRALFELARRDATGPVSVSEIAEAQAIPSRFLEVILHDLKRGGFVESRRGARGGYLLTVPAESILVGNIIRFIDGPIAPVRCVAEGDSSDCPFHGNCAFMNMWMRAMQAACEVYDNTSVKDLVMEQETGGSGELVPNYCI